MGQAPGATAPQAGPPRHGGGHWERWEGGEPRRSAPPRPAEPRSPGRGGRAPWARCCGGISCGPAAPRWTGARTTTPSCPPSPSSTTRCAAGGRVRGPGTAEGCAGGSGAGHGAPWAGGAEGPRGGAPRVPRWTWYLGWQPAVRFRIAGAKSGGLDRAVSHEWTMRTFCPVLPGPRVSRAGLLRLLSRGTGVSLPDGVQGRGGPRADTLGVWRQNRVLKLCLLPEPNLEEQFDRGLQGAVSTVLLGVTSRKVKKGRRGKRTEVTVSSSRSPGSLLTPVIPAQELLRGAARQHWWRHIPHSRDLGGECCSQHPVCYSSEGSQWQTDPTGSEIMHQTFWWCALPCCQERALQTTCLCCCSGFSVLWQVWGGVSALCDLCTSKWPFNFFPQFCPHLSSLSVCVSWLLKSDDSVTLLWRKERSVWSVHPSQECVLRDVLHLEQTVQLCMVYMANLLFLLVVQHQSHLGGISSVFEGVWWNRPLSLFLMSLCKNQKQKEEKVRINNKFLEETMRFEASSAGGWISFWLRWAD